MSIQISDANPIQIFYDDEDTFNENRVENIDNECYIYEHQCDTDVLQQIFDDESDDTYDWVIFDENDVEIDRVDMDAEEITAEQETEDLEDFENIASGPSWVIDAEPNIAIPDGVPIFSTVESKIIAPPSQFLFEPSKMYRFNINYDVNGQFMTLKIVLLDENDTVLQTSNILTGGTPGNFNVSRDLVIPEGAVKYGFRAARTLLGGSFPTATLEINSHSIERLAYTHEVIFNAEESGYCNRTLRFEVQRQSDNSLFGHTDKIYFPEEISGAILVMYRSAKNFAGLIYDENSEYRYHFIKGRFFHPGKSGSAAYSEQSNGTVLTRNWTMKKKKKLEVQDCPEYENTKIDLILAHCVDGELIIKEVDWMLADGDQYQYQGAEDRPDRYPFQPGEAWLTRKNYFKQNTL